MGRFKDATTYIFLNENNGRIQKMPPHTQYAISEYTFLIYVMVFTIYTIIVF